MVVVSVNLGIGYASSGVEYAQAYRSKLFRGMGRKQKNVFLDFMPDDCIYDMTDNLGISSVVWLYDYFRDEAVVRSSVSLEELEEKYGSVDEERSTEFKKYIGTGSDFILASMSRFDGGIVTAIEYVTGGFLTLKEYYSGSSVYCRERFTPIDGVATRYVREFYDSQGMLYLHEFIDDTVNSRFYYKGELFPNKEALFKRMMSVVLSKRDFVLLDRSTGTAKAMLSLRDAIGFRMGVVVHAEHFVYEGSSERDILWNNYYDYVFRNSDSIDVFICSTQRQAEVLEGQFKTFYGREIVTRVIPVGYIKELKGIFALRDPRKLVTVSRLSSEKNLDLLIESLALVRDKGYDFSLDIYGEGSELSSLESLVSEHGLGGRVSFKGHRDMDSLYEDYSCYVSASSGEGFGLSLMEAMGSGLYLVGFGVNYGNTSFCRESENGYLAPYVFGSRKRNVQSLAKAIVGYFEGYHSLNRGISYSVAENYLESSVVESWRYLLNDKSI